MMISSMPCRKAALLPPLVFGLLVAWGNTALARSEDFPPIVVEGEDWVSAYDIGGEPIGNEYCDQASEYRVVDHIDRPGEWVEYLVPFVHPGYYKLHARLQGYLGIDYEVRISLLGAGPNGEDLRAEFDFVGPGTS